MDVKATVKQQGKVATGLALGMVKDTAALISCRTRLTFQVWPYLHQARLGRLPVRGCPGSKSTNKKCRLGCGKLETTGHVVCCCQVNSALSIKRHNSILDLMVAEAEALAHSVPINHSIDSTGMRPDIVVTSTNPAIIIDVTVPLSCAEGLARAKDKKIEKYKHLGSVLPLVVGSLGSWLPSNDAISLALSIPGRRWNNLKRKMNLLAIQGTTRIIYEHLAYHTEESDPMPEEDEETEDKVFCNFFSKALFSVHLKIKSIKSVLISLISDTGSNEPKNIKLIFGIRWDINACIDPATG
ncbi:Uncharacterized protein APZ42_033330 [Daphnia magna]|uniref:Uncharacterized protein n=1 Tax=Daphnia magna TaxID=35525 RepID=A0A164L6Y5_9CRUS|nr:Uncharacterized protein APZ42_033330 [Daphnia magna]